MGQFNSVLIWEIDWNIVKHCWTHPYTHPPTHTFTLHFPSQLSCVTPVLSLTHTNKTVLICFPLTDSTKGYRLSIDLLKLLKNGSIFTSDLSLHTVAFILELKWFSIPWHEISIFRKFVEANKIKKGFLIKACSKNSLTQTDCWALGSCCLTLCILFV